MITLQNVSLFATNTKDHKQKHQMIQILTPSPLDCGQLLQVLQLTHKMSLPVSIWTLNSLGGEPIFTLVKYNLNKKAKISHKYGTS